LALTTHYMRMVIRANGHLIMDGSERKEDLRKALLYLRQHTYMKCHRPHLGTPIDSLIPDISVLEEGPIKRKNARWVNVDLSDERL
jgi:hypothetical protein